MTLTVLFAAKAAVVFILITTASGQTLQQNYQALAPYLVAFMPFSQPLGFSDASSNKISATQLVNALAAGNWAQGPTGNSNTGYYLPYGLSDNLVKYTSTKFNFASSQSWTLASFVFSNYTKGPIMGFNNGTHHGSVMTLKGMNTIAMLRSQEAGSENVTIPCRINDTWSSVAMSWDSSSSALKAFCNDNLVNSISLGSNLPWAFSALSMYWTPGTLGGFRGTLACPAIFNVSINSNQLVTYKNLCLQVGSITCPAGCPSNCIGNLAVPSGSSCTTCSTPCQNGGYCIGANLCSCFAGFTGSDCSATTTSTSTSTTTTTTTTTIAGATIATTTSMATQASSGGTMASSAGSSEELSRGYEKIGEIQQSPSQQMQQDFFPTSVIDSGGRGATTTTAQILAVCSSFAADQPAPPASYNTTVTWIRPAFNAKKLTGISTVDETITVSGQVLLTWSITTCPVTSSDSLEDTTQLKPERLYISHREQVWTPDYMYLDTAHDADVYMNSDDSYGEDLTATIFSEPTNPNKTVTFYSIKGGLFSSSCSLDLTKFPFDKQTCLFSFSLLRSIDLVQFRDPVFYWPALHDERSSDQWHYLSRAVSISTLRYGGFNVSTVYFIVALKRNPTYYIVNLALPSIILLLVEMCSFILPPGELDRPGFSMTILLALTVSQSSVASQIPITSQNVLLADYINALSWLCALCLIYQMVAVYLCFTYDKVEEDDAQGEQSGDTNEDERNHENEKQQINEQLRRRSVRSSYLPTTMMAKNFQKRTKSTSNSCKRPSLIRRLDMIAAIVAGLGFVFIHIYAIIVYYRK